MAHNAKKTKLSKRLINNSATAVNEILQHLWNMGLRDPQRVLTLASLRLHHLESRDGAGWAQRCLRLQREYREGIEADERRTYRDPRPNPGGGPRRAA